VLGQFDTAVNSAFPVITAAFSLTRREMQWVVIPLVLAQSSLMLIFERLGDLFGYRRILVSSQVKTCSGAIFRIP
jgi:MFS family permease